MGKKKARVEDVISEDILKSILHIYHTIKSKRSLHLKDYTHILTEGNKLHNAIAKAAATGFLDDELENELMEKVSENIRLKTFHINDDYYFLSQIETVFYDSDSKIFKRKTAGGLNELELDFLLLALIEEIRKRYSGKPEYEMLREYLDSTGILKDYNQNKPITFNVLAKKFERARKIKPHIKEILETYFNHTAKKLTLLADD